MKKYSLRFKMTLILVLAVTAAILLSWIANKVFLPSYYQYTKLKTLDTAYTQIYSVIESSIIENEIDINAIDGHGQEWYRNSVFTEDEIIKIYRIIENNNINIHIFKLGYPVLFSNDWYEALQIYEGVFKFYLLDYNILKGAEKLKETEHYTVFKTYDYNKESDYIDLCGEIGNGKYIFIRTNFVSIQESTNIANKFFAYVGFAAVVTSAVIMFVISRGFTKPIQDMSYIAKRMTDLDFEVYYPVKTHDELGELGKSLNTLSKKLETTISELKSANNELMIDIEKKVEIDEMRKDFLSNVTHELKTPIALIQGYAEGLKENIHDDEQSREFYCEVIIDEAIKMNNMVKKLLSLNQIEAGTGFEMERFDITSLVNSVINSFDILIKQKELIVHFEEKEAVYVWADEYLIEEAVTNYLSNAIHHVKGAKIIEVKFIKYEDKVRVAVFNTGDLIPEDEIEKIWIKFYKVDKSRSREYGGNGIGLSIVKAIMDAHNKSYGVVNHLNGVEFWFELDAHA